MMLTVCKINKNIWHVTVLVTLCYWTTIYSVSNFEFSQFEYSDQINCEAYHAPLIRSMTDLYMEHYILSNKDFNLFGISYIFLIRKILFNSRFLRRVDTKNLNIFDLCITRMHTSQRESDKKVMNRDANDSQSVD